MPLIKRVIGEPGDTVSLQRGDVYVNGVVIDEPYVHDAPTMPENGETDWTVPADQIFVMGDNRQFSQDSRTFGPICTTDVIGRAFLRYWPLSEFGILPTPTYPDVPPAQGN